VPAPTLDPRTDIGHVHLQVADLERSLGFYRDVLGFEVSGSIPDAAFLTVGAYHHRIALNAFASKGGTPPPAGSTGLFHFAIRYPTRAALVAAVRAVQDAGIALTGARDHGASVAVYLRDPDEIGIELTWDRPAADWPRGADGSLLALNDPLDVDALLASP
jgi:catechol 2,3-dioxygenase